MDKGQTGRYSQAELDLMKLTFNDDTLLQLRDHFYQFSTMSLPVEVITLLRKFFNPQLDADLPLIPQASNYFAISAIREYPLELATLHMAAMDTVCQFMEDRLTALSSNDNSGKSLNDLKAKSDKSSNDRFTDMLAFNILVNNLIDSCIGQIRTIVNAKVETAEESAAKAAANSSK